jgi:precorrin-2/cobalt-factor-2 C20-methyltransferase
VQTGILYGIGVGPGDPELITLKGLRLLKQVPVVAFPEGRGKTGMAQEIVAQWLSPHQVHLPLDFAFARDENLLAQAWQIAAQKVWHYLEQGQDVAFVCEGDISFYSTFTYLAQTLQQFYPQAIVQAIPGICSPMAAAAALGVPLTVRHQRLAILPALYAPDELETALDWADVVVLMKVSSVYDRVWQILQRRQLLKQSWVVERVALPNQIIYSDLSDRPHLQLSYFSLLIIRVK